MREQPARMRTAVNGSAPYLVKITGGFMISASELPEGIRMDRNSKEYRTTYAALKLIEYLFQKGQISDTVYRNILRDYGDEVDLSDFKCYK